MYLVYLRLDPAKLYFRIFKRIFHIFHSPAAQPTRVRACCPCLRPFDGGVLIFDLFRFRELAASGLGKLSEQTPPLNPPGGAVQWGRRRPSSQEQTARQALQSKQRSDHKQQKMSIGGLLVFFDPSIAQIVMGLLFAVLWFGIFCKLSQFTSQMLNLINDACSVSIILALIGALSIRATQNAQGLMACPSRWCLDC